MFQFKFTLHEYEESKRGVELFSHSLSDLSLTFIIACRGKNTIYLCKRTVFPYSVCAYNWEEEEERERGDELTSPYFLHLKRKVNCSFSVEKIDSSQITCFRAPTEVTERERASTFFSSSLFLSLASAFFHLPLHHLWLVTAISTYCAVYRKHLIDLLISHTHTYIYIHRMNTHTQSNSVRKEDLYEWDYTWFTCVVTLDATNVRHHENKTCKIYYL